MLAVSDITNLSGTSAFVDAIKSYYVVTDPVYGAKGDGATDDYTAITAAMSAASAAGGGTVYLPPTGHAYKIGTGLSVPLGVRLVGNSSRTLQTGNNLASAWCAYGSWIQCTDATNPAVTFIATSGTGYNHGTGIQGINFFYSQSAPGGGSWTPTVYPYAISVQANLVELEDVFVVGASHGIEVKSPTIYGVGEGIMMRNIYISSFTIGIHTEGVNDPIQWDGIWFEEILFGSGNQANTYYRNNHIAWDCYYTDNLIANGVYIYNSHIGMKFTDATLLGNTHSGFNLSITNLQFNLVQYAITASSATVTGIFNNVYAQSDSVNSVSTTLFSLSSDSIDFQIVGLDVIAGGGVFDLGAGSSGLVRVNDFKLTTYGAFDATKYIFNTAAGATAVLGGNYSLSGVGAGVKTGAGTLKYTGFDTNYLPSVLTELGLTTQISTWTPAVAFGGNSVGITYSNQTGHYTRIGNTVIMQFDVTMSAVGSSTGAATITGFPYGTVMLAAGCLGYANGMSGLTGAVQFYNNGSTANIMQSGSTGTTSLTNSNFTSSSRLIGTVTVQLS